MCECSTERASSAINSGAQLSRGSQGPEMVHRWVLVCSSQDKLMCGSRLFSWCAFCRQFSWANKATSVVPVRTAMYRALV